MRWLWRQAPVDEGPPTKVDQAAADDALRRAKKARAEQQARWASVDEVAAAAHAHEKENHFAELVAFAMRRRRA